MTVISATKVRLISILTFIHKLKRQQSKLSIFIVKPTLAQGLEPFIS